MQHLYAVSVKKVLIASTIVLVGALIVVKFLPEILIAIPANPVTHECTQYSPGTNGHYVNAPDPKFCPQGDIPTMRDSFYNTTTTVVTLIIASSASFLASGLIQLSRVVLHR